MTKMGQDGGLTVGSCRFLWNSGQLTRVTRGEGRRRPDPGLVAIMVDSHHLATTQTYQGDQWREVTPVRPNIQDANLRLRGSDRRVDDRFEGDALLEEVVRALAGRNGVELGIGGGEDDALAGKGEER